MFLDNDYVDKPVTVTMLPNETQACAYIGITQDVVYEPNETFCVTVTSSHPVGIFQPEECQIMITIVDDIGKSSQCFCCIYCDTPLLLGCISYYADIMIIADTFNIVPQYMSLLKEFILNVTDQYPVSSRETNIGLIRFTTSSTMVDINVNQITNKTQLLNTIDGIRFDQPLDGAHKHAIKTGLDNLRDNGRSDARDIVMFITEGRIDLHSKSARSIVAEAHHNGTAIYGVYIGESQIGRSEIARISDPGRAHFVTSYVELNSVVNGFVREACSRKFILIILSTPVT